MHSRLRRFLEEALTVSVSVAQGTALYCKMFYYQTKADVFSNEYFGEIKIKLHLKPPLPSLNSHAKLDYLELIDVIYVKNYIKICKLLKV